MSSMLHKYLASLIGYIFFGAIHELFHFVAAKVFISSSSSLTLIHPSVLFNILIGRRFVLIHPEDIVIEEKHIHFVTHSGWIGSLLIAFVCIYLSMRQKSRPFTNFNQSFAFPAFITALEAISTDLVGIPPLFSRFLQVDENRICFFCGNFGIILLHSAWLSNGDELALDILEKMINVTMMRGAQSGGVVTFERQGRGSSERMVGIRTRVVKSKRGDLAKMLRSRLEESRISQCLSRQSQRLQSVRFYSGHTRFATSSKASFDGTHPHIWTPPTVRRVYDFDYAAIRHKRNAVAGSPDDENDAALSLSNSLGRSILGSSTSFSGRQRGPISVIMSPRDIRVENYISHNGDYDYFELNGEIYDIDVIQKWLEIATETKMPSTVDSAAIAGMVDLIRTKGCFGLSIRYVVCLGLPQSKMTEDPSQANLPKYHQCESLGLVFEGVLADMQSELKIGIEAFESDRSTREQFATRVQSKFDENPDSLGPFTHLVRLEDDGGGYYSFILAVIDAFFDNDLFYTVKYFMANARGSFGLCVSSSLDAHRQICLAARGQTISIAFYPNASLICYGSEQAAVKAALNVDFPLDRTRIMERSHLDIKNDAMRLDLDDLGGEICLIDWGGRSGRQPAVSFPNRSVSKYPVMKNQVNIFLHQETTLPNESRFLHRRMTKLTRNPFIKALKDDYDDLVLQDIKDIPDVVKNIQLQFHEKNLNRLTAWHFGQCIKSRLEKYISGSLVTKANTVDICVTGCEVSLWVAEQFASDLQKSFPKLRTIALSSNKLLGLFGQDISIPAVGFGTSEKTLDLTDSVIIIVSHSGGTFSPLACASLLQSFTKNIFSVVSEWDTQVAKQLRNLNKEKDPIKLLLNSRIFSTDVGMRAAEPCSVSVVATHQLLTNILLHLSVIILSDERYRKVTGAVITERDIEIIERCNQDNITALLDIVRPSDKELELRRMGDIWAEHVLENVKAYIMSFVYIIVAVTSGYPVISGIAIGAGLPRSSQVLYFLRFLDALIFFFLPQINVFIIRLIQKRALLHRMTARTVVIGDVPWVAQSAEAFLSKLFACSYSIAGLNVLCANPSDHLVHRMTHRVVRGTLLICGRPDGRLSALSSMETAVCLAVNQASSIQSLGSTCESITIGHNPFKLPLSAQGIFLNRHRPLFLCEMVLGEPFETQPKSSLGDPHHIKISTVSKSVNRPAIVAEEESSHAPKAAITKKREKMLSSGTSDEIDNFLDQRKSHSGSALVGIYKKLEMDMLHKFAAENSLDKSRRCTLAGVINSAVFDKKWSDGVRRLFEVLDVDKDGVLSMDEFIRGYHKLNPNLSRSQLLKVFHECDKTKTGLLRYDDFFSVISTPELDLLESLEPENCRDENGLIQVKASREAFFGEALARGLDFRTLKESVSVGATKSQHFSQELYESRIASVQRFCAMLVIFHQIGKRVRDFFSKISFGLLYYRMDRTHSIMRIATTASPVSGSDVRDRARSLYLRNEIDRAVTVISRAWRSHRRKHSHFSTGSA